MPHKRGIIILFWRKELPVRKERQKVEKRQRIEYYEKEGREAFRKGVPYHKSQLVGSNAAAWYRGWNAEKIAQLRSNSQRQRM